VISDKNNFLASKSVPKTHLLGLLLFFFEYLGLNLVESRNNYYIILKLKEFTIASSLKVN
jgi:hypothetical protein